MVDKDWKEFLEKAKAEYYKIGNIPCPAFGSEFVHFNKHGFNHLLRKGRKLREQSKQQKRIDLIQQAVSIVRHTKHIRDYRTTKLGSSVCHFWEIRGKGTYNSKSMIIHVIIRRKNSGRLHFFSVF